MSANPQAAAMLAYVDSLRDRTAQPDLTSVLDIRTPPPTVSPRTSVRDAARLMKERRTTAVCVMESNPGTSAVSGMSTNAAPKIAGIFTSKDIVLRVIAAGLDAQRCSVVRVMTPHPDTAPPTLTVQDALKKMHSEEADRSVLTDRRTLSKLAGSRDRWSTGRNRGRSQAHLCNARASTCIGKDAADHRLNR